MSFLDRFRKKNYDLNGNRFYQEYIVNTNNEGNSDFLKVAASLSAGLRIAEGIAAMPIVYGMQEYDELGRCTKKPLPLGKPGSTVSLEKQLPYLLGTAPNDYMTATEFFETMTLHAVFEGVGRAYIDRGYRGAIRRIIPLTTNPISSAKDPDTGKVYYRGTIPGVGDLEGMTRKDFIEVTNPRWMDIEGLDIASQLKDVLRLATSLQKRQQEDAGKKQVSGFFTFNEAIGAEAASQVQEAMKDKLPNTPILDSGAQYKQLLPTASEMQLLESRRFAIEEVSRAFGIHPLLLAHDAAGQSLTRIADVMDYHVTITLAPWVRRFEAAIKFSLLEANEYLDLDEQRYYRMSLVDRSEYGAKALGGGGSQAWATPNEIRVGMGQNPIEGGDELPAKSEVPDGNQILPD